MDLLHNKAIDFVVVVGFIFGTILIICGGSQIKATYFLQNQFCQIEKGVAMLCGEPEMEKYSSCLI
jgi:hypothetical protein